METLQEQILNLNDEIFNHSAARDNYIQNYGPEFYEVEYEMYEVEIAVENILMLLDQLGGLDNLNFDLDYRTEQEIKMYKKINNMAA